MLSRIFKLLKRYLSKYIPENYKTEFVIGINKTNIKRAKLTAMIFIILETAMLITFPFMKKSAISVYYGYMYVILLLLMIAFLLIFIKLGNNVPRYCTVIRYTGILFIGIILVWCAGISLLDQLTNGQVIVYVVAIISIAITPYYEPFLLFLIYMITHLFFLFLLPYFQSSASMVFANSINSTSFIIISWAISIMRYKKYIDGFKNEKMIFEKNEELQFLNNKLIEVNKKLENLSSTDSLTGIYNRSIFDAKIIEEWNRCRRHSIPLSLIMIDIDYFKSYNDIYGHRAGDQCLQQVAKTLSACARRSSDLVARYGGEEFAIILPHTDVKSAFNLAEKIRKKVEDMNILHNNAGNSGYLTISLGVNAVIPLNELSIEEFINNTDKALYKAKEKRNHSSIAL